MRAVIMRDLKSRAFGSELGFLFTTAWPLSHIIILLILYSFLNRAAPYGDSISLWFATGVIPFQAFAYISRFMVLGVITNRASLLVPVVKMSDILLARLILEIISATIVVLILFIAFWFLDIDFVPMNVPEAFYAMMATALLGIGMGVFNGIVATFAPMWVTGYFLLMIIVWISSGVVTSPDALPESVQLALSYNPAFQCVAWMRSAYYEGYGDHFLSRIYLISWGVGGLFLGLLAERVFRGKILSG